LGIESVKSIISLYEEGRTTKEISTQLDIPVPTVISNLKRYRVALRPPRRRYTLNEEYFNDINSIDKAYFLGLLYADGNISKTKDGYRVKIGLQERDSYILERLSFYCEFNGPILFRKGASKNHQNQKLLQIYSKGFYENARKQGLHDNKTFTLKPPSLEPYYIKHFIRGYFDGDGCAFIKTYKSQTSTSISFLGTYSICSFIKNYLQDTLQLRSNTKILTKKSIFKYTINDRKDILKIKNFLYTDMEDCYLTRKLEKLQEMETYIINYYEKHPNRY
jgi:hypothetical protein